MVSLTINNKTIECEDHLTIIEAAKENGINIPSLLLTRRAFYWFLSGVCCGSRRSADTSGVLHG